MSVSGKCIVCAKPSGGKLHGACEELPVRLEKGAPVGAGAQRETEHWSPSVVATLELETSQVWGLTLSF